MDIPTDTIRQYLPESLKQFTSYAITTMLHHRRNYFVGIL